MTNDIKIFIGVIVSTLVLIIGAVFLFGKNNSSPVTTNSGQKVEAKVLAKDNSWSTGPQDAKVTLVEFGDFQCPACGVEEPIVKSILAKYQNKIRFVWREFPLTQVHQFAFDAALAAEAAGMQNKFWPYHDKLFENQPTITKTDSFKREQLIAFAKDIGLDMEKFTKDIDSDAVRERVLNDQQDGNSAQINGTPSFFINGEVFSSGKLPTEADFSAKIESLLK